MAWRFPPLNSLRAFEAAGRRKSFTLAAEELHVTPGAVSRQIKALEEKLGICLFARNNREVRLTPDSKEYLDSLTEAFRRIDKSTSDLLDSRREKPLRIMCSMIVAARWLFPRLPRFLALHPNRHVSLTTAGLYYLKFIEPLKSPNLIKSSTKKFDIGPLRSTNRSQDRPDL